jgi:hypothetical protein
MNDSGDLPSPKGYGKACENGLRGSEFHSLTVLSLPAIAQRATAGRRSRSPILNTED